MSSNPSREAVVADFRLQRGLLFLELFRGRRRGWWSYSTSGVKARLAGQSGCSLLPLAFHRAEGVLSDLRLALRILQGHAALTGIRAGAGAGFRHLEDARVYRPEILIYVLRLNGRHGRVLILQSDRNGLASQTVVSRVVTERGVQQGLVLVDVAAQSGIEEALLVSETAQSRVYDLLSLGGSRGEVGSVPLFLTGLLVIREGDHVLPGVGQDP